MFHQTCQRVLESLGWRWVPTMKIGGGGQVHLKAAEFASRPVNRPLFKTYDGSDRRNHS